MKSSRSRLFPAILLALAPALAFAQEPPAPKPEPVAAPPGSGVAIPTEDDPTRPYPLMLGDPVPEFKFSQFILGEPVEKWEKGKVYVLFPFAMFCDPCLNYMNRLSLLQNELGPEGLTVIGVTSPASTNSIEAVQEYVYVKAKEIINFPIAWDRNRFLFDHIMNPAGTRRIPTVTIIDREGRIAYFGNAATFEKPLREIVKGVHDLDRAKRLYLNDIHMSWGMYEYDKKMSEGDIAGAYNLGRDILFRLGPESFFAASSIAWSIVNPAKMPEKLDLDLALSAATRACELSEWKDGETIDTLARVHFLRGELDQAVTHQATALEFAHTSRTRTRFEQSLKQYKDALEGKPAEAGPTAPAN